MIICSMPGCQTTAGCQCSSPVSNEPKPYRHIEEIERLRAERDEARAIVSDMLANTEGMLDRYMQENSAECERLRAALSAAEEHVTKAIEAGVRAFGQQAALTTAAENRADTAERRLAEAMEVLRPFAEFDCEDFADSVRLFEDTPAPTIGDCRRARAILSQEKP